MDTIYFTLTGTRYYQGQEFLKEGMRVQLVKEPDNQHDKEAILVRMEGIGDIGHVANSHYSVIGESFSAGRLYDKINDTAYGKVLYVLPGGVLCELSRKSLREYRGKKKQTEKK